jgi:hypothetical protein
MATMDTSSYTSMDTSSFTSSSTDDKVPSRTSDAASSVCVVCGVADDNLSSLGRCWTCIQASAAAFATARIAAEASTPNRVRRCYALGRGLNRFLHATPHTAGCPEAPPGPPVDRLAGLRRAKRQAPAHAGGDRVLTGSPAARLSGLLSRLAAATEGERNSVLHWASCRVGEMVAEGSIPDARRAAAALAEVAVAVGLKGDVDRGEIGGTIRSGFSKSGVAV